MERLDAMAVFARAVEAEGFSRAALRAELLVDVPPERSEPTDTAIYAVYPAARHLPPKVGVFVDFLAERFGGTPYWDEGLSA